MDRSALRGGDKKAQLEYVSLFFFFYCFVMFGSLLVQIVQLCSCIVILAECVQ